MRFFTSDLHFGHRNIIEYCPDRQKLPGVVMYPGEYNVTAMNEELILRWNDTVRPNDEVWIVGDLCMGKLTESLALVSRLNGRKWLFVGNHDRPFKEKGREKWELTYEEAGIDILIHGSLTTGIGTELVVVNHFPYEGDSHDEDRFVEQRPRNNGHILIHGHVHDAWKVNGRQINVGCDVWDYRPVSELELIDLIGTIG